MQDKIVINGVVLNDDDQDLINQAYIDQYGKLDYENPDFNNRMDALAKDYSSWKKGDLDEKASKLVNSSWTNLRAQTTPQYHNALKHLAGMPLSSLDEPYAYPLPEVKVTAEKKKPFIGPKQGEYEYDPTTESFTNVSGFDTPEEKEKRRLALKETPFFSDISDALSKAVGGTWQAIGSLFSDIKRFAVESRKFQEEYQDEEGNLIFDPEKETKQIAQTQRKVFTEPGSKIKQTVIKDTEQVPWKDPKTGEISSEGIRQGVSGLVGGLAPYLIPLGGEEMAAEKTANIVKGVLPKLSRFGARTMENFVTQFPKVYNLTKGTAIEEADKMGLSDEDAQKFATANGIMTTLAFSIPGAIFTKTPNQSVAKFVLNPKNFSTASKLVEYGTGLASSASAGVLANVGERISKNEFAGNRIPQQNDVVTVVSESGKPIKENVKVLGAYDDGTYQVEGISEPLTKESLQIQPESLLSQEALQSYGQSALTMMALHSFMDYKTTTNLFKNGNKQYTNTMVGLAQPLEINKSLEAIDNEIRSGAVTPEQGAKAKAVITKISPYVNDALIQTATNKKFNKKYIGNYVFASAERGDLINKRNELAKEVSSTLTPGESVTVRDGNSNVINNNATLTSVDVTPEGEIMATVEGVEQPVSIDNITPNRNSKAVDQMNILSQKIKDVNGKIKQITDGKAFKGRLVQSAEVVNAASDVSPNGRLRPSQEKVIANIPGGFYSDSANPFLFENQPLVKKELERLRKGNAGPTPEQSTMPVIIDAEGNVIDGAKRVARAIYDFENNNLGAYGSEFEVLRPITLGEMAKNISDLSEADPETQRKAWDQTKVPTSPEAAADIGVEEIPEGFTLEEAARKIFGDTKEKTAASQDGITAEDVLDDNVYGDEFDTATNTTISAKDKIKAFIEEYNNTPDANKEKKLQQFVDELNNTVQGRDDAGNIVIGTLVGENKISTPDGQVEVTDIQKVFGKNPDLEALRTTVNFLRKMGVPKDQLATALHNSVAPSYQGKSVRGMIEGFLKYLDKKGYIPEQVKTYADVEAKRKKEAEEAQQAIERKDKRAQSRDIKLNQFAERVASNGRLAFAKNKADQAFYERNKEEIDRRAENVKLAKKQQAEKEARTQEGIPVVGQVEGKPTAQVEPTEERTNTTDIEAKKADIERRRQEELKSEEYRTTVKSELFQAEDGSYYKVELQKDGKNKFSITDENGNTLTDLGSYDSSVPFNKIIADKLTKVKDLKFTNKAVDKVNAKYDAEINVLEESTKKPTEETKPAETNTVESIEKNRNKELADKRPRQLTLDENGNLIENRGGATTGTDISGAFSGGIMGSYQQIFDALKNGTNIIGGLKSREVEMLKPLYDKGLIKSNVDVYHRLNEPEINAKYDKQLADLETKPAETKTTETETIVGANVLGKDATGAEVVGEVINEMANGDVIVRTEEGNVVVKADDIIDIGGKTAVIPEVLTEATEFDPFAFESEEEYTPTEEEGTKFEHTQKSKEAEFTREENREDVKDLFDQLRKLGLLESKGKDCL